MVPKLIIRLVKAFYKGPHKGPLLSILSLQPKKKEEIIDQIKQLFTAYENGYYIYLQEAERSEALIEFFSTDPEDVSEFAKFLEDFNSEFNSEIASLTKEVFHKHKHHLVTFGTNDANEILDCFFLHRNLLARKMNKMLNSRLLVLDEQIATRHYMKTVSGENRTIMVVPDDDKWN